MGIVGHRLTPSHIAQINSISLRHRPAKLTSFAVVNFAKEASCYDFVKTTLRVAQSHGIEIPSMTRDDRWLDCVTEHYNGRHPVDEVSKWGVLVYLFSFLVF